MPYTLRAVITFSAVRVGIGGDVLSGCKVDDSVPGIATMQETAKFQR